MSLYDDFEDFLGSLAHAGTNAPDDYADQIYWTYETHMADLKELWAAIRPQLKRDLETAKFVDSKLQEMFTAFDAGEKEKGRAIVWELYNAELEELR